MALLNTQSIVAHHDICKDLKSQHYSLIRAADFELSTELQAEWEQLKSEYPAMPPDKFLPDGGAYRFRRYDSFKLDPVSGALCLLPHGTYFQSEDINAVTGGIMRDFAPLTESIANNQFLHELIRFDFAQFPMEPAMREGEWIVDVHLIRVIARHDEAGQPTPEGIHRDGAEWVTVHLAELSNVDGGEVSVYDNDRNFLASFTLDQELDAYLFQDEVLWHGVTPVTLSTEGEGVRSILTFDYHFVR